MKKNIFITILLFSFFANSQTIIPEITARVDTSKKAIKEVYHLYKNYINSKPDSIYKNPNWNEKEAEIYLKNKLLKIDRSVNKMYNYYNSNQYLSYFTPKILQIDSIAQNRYQIKTLFAHDCSEIEYKNATPDCITKLYAVRNSSGIFKLENVMSYDTKNWKTYDFKFIKYIVHPNCSFDKNEALKAVKFCKKIGNQFKIKIEPFTFYILPNSDEMGKLYNFEYWMSYLGGQTIIPSREIFSTFGSANYPHEFVHILFPLPKDNVSYCPTIVNEGLATWLAGPGYNETFENSLIQTSKIFQKQNIISLDDIINFKFKNDFDNSILYVTGGVICKLVYEKKGEKGIWELYNSTDNNFKIVLEKVFEKPYENIEKTVIEYIINYSKQ
jgi:hypothetical protein